MKILALLAIAIPSVARANELNLASLADEPNRVQVTTGAEYAFVAGAGYSRVLPFLDRKIVIGGDVTLPWAGFDLSDYRVRLSALLPIIDHGPWKFAGSLAPLLRGNSNDISTLVDVGLDTSVIGGFYHRRFFVAGELGFDAAISTHVSHTDEYRMNVHPDAVDGWYANPGGNLRAGAQVGVSFLRHDVILRVGQVRDTDGGPPLIPFYGTLTVNARW